MQVAKSTLTIRPAPQLPRPSPPGQGELRRISDLGVRGVAVDTWLVAPLIDQCGEGIVTLLEAVGEGRAWPYATAGSGLGLLLGGLQYVDARRHGDAAGTREALRKMVVSGLGVVSGVGLCAGRPELQGSLEAIRIVLGSSSFAAGHTVNLAPARTRVSPLG